MRLFFLTIPKPLKQHPLYKKITHSANTEGFGRKTPRGLNYLDFVTKKIMSKPCIPLKCNQNFLRRYLITF
jgi:hypothetical protein